MRLKDRKIRFASRLHPGFKCPGAHNRLFSDKGGWDALRLVVIARRDSHQGSLVRIRAIKFLFQVIDETADLIRNEFFLCDLAQGCKLLAPGLIAAGRHVDLLVPTQYIGCAANVRDLAQSFFQLFKFLTHGISYSKMISLLTNSGNLPAERFPSQGREYLVGDILRS